jgi:HTH-type transcriptional regulator/antitoxin HipB
MDQSARTPEQLAQILRGIRKRRKLSQTSAGAPMGLPQKTVSAFELHPDGSTLATLCKLLAALDLELTVRPRVQSSSSSSTHKPEW